MEDLGTGRPKFGDTGRFTPGIWVGFQKGRGLICPGSSLQMG